MWEPLNSFDGSLRKRGGGYSSLRLCLLVTTELYGRYLGCQMTNFAALLVSVLLSGICSYRILTTK